MKNLILLFTTTLILTACGDEIDPTINIEEPTTPPIEVASEPVKQGHNFEQDEFSFYGKTELTQDMFVSAETITFKLGSEVKLNSFTLKLEANDVVFERDTKLIAYFPKEYAACKSPGKNGGNAEIEAERVSGSPFIDLAGQNTGQIGIYSVAQAGKPLHPGHAKIGGDNKWWFKGCVTFIKGKGPIHVPHLFIPRDGSLGGKLYISVDSATDFKPKISTRVSHGSYEALIEGLTSRSTSWWRIAPRGPDGTQGEVCFDVDGEFLCK